MPSKSAALARIRSGERVFDEAHDLAWRAKDEIRNALRLSDLPLLQAGKAKAIEAIERNERCFEAYHVICLAAWFEHLRQWSDDAEASEAQLADTARSFIRLAPTSPRAFFWNGISSMVSGRAEIALKDLRRSVELNPNDSMALTMLATLEVNIGDIEIGKTVAEKVIRFAPNDPWTGTAYLALAEAAYHEGDSNFRDWAEKSIQAQPDAPVRRLLMIAHASDIGDPELLDEHLQQLNSFAPRLISRFLSGELKFSGVARIRKRLMNALREAGLGE